MVLAVSCASATGLGFVRATSGSMYVMGVHVQYMQSELSASAAKPMIRKAQTYIASRPIAGWCPFLEHFPRDLIRTHRYVVHQ